MLDRRRKKAEDTRRIWCRNVGSETEKGGKIVDVMMKRKLGTQWVQEVNWRDNCSRQLGIGYTLAYTGESTKESGIGLAVRAELTKKVVKVERH